MQNVCSESIQAIAVCDTSRRILRLQNFSSESLQAIGVCDTSRRIRLRMAEMRGTAARRILLNLVKDSLHTGALCDTSRGIRQLQNLSSESLRPWGLGIRILGLSVREKLTLGLGLA